MHLQTKHAAKALDQRDSAGADRLVANPGLLDLVTAWPGASRQL